ncbi:hypothetical protein [Proteiniphilum acetatigenes]
MTTDGVKYYLRNLVREGIIIREELSQT